MTSGYRNSAGTDLDNLFLVNDSGLGAVGFLTSSGTDIGNRYRGGSLGYSVGYRDMSGTDLGSLRGTLAPPRGSASIRASNVHHDMYETGVTNANGVTHYSTVYGATFTPVLTTPNQEITWATLTLQYQFRQGNSYTVYFKSNTNSTTLPYIPMDSKTGEITGYDSYYWVNNSTREKWTNLATYTPNNFSDFSPISVFARVDLVNTYTWNQTMDLRFILNLTNEAGSNTITSSTFTKILNAE